MDVTLWIIAGVLAVAFPGAGLMKISQPKAKLAASGMAWTDDFSPATVKLIGALEILAAIGLVVPAAAGVAPVLVPLAATGLVLVMVGAAITHARRHEPPMIAGNLILLALAAVVVWGRFGPYSVPSQRRPLQLGAKLAISPKTLLADELRPGPQPTPSRRK